MSNSSNTTAKSTSPSERAALAQAAKLIAGKPGMSPASALRKAGIKSSAKIKQLSVEIRRQKASHGQRKASDAVGGRRRSNRGKAVTTSKALSTSRGASKKAAQSAPVNLLKAAVQSTSPAMVLQNDLMTNWLNLYVRWWSQMMKWTPLGMMIPANSAEDPQRRRASSQWFSNLKR